jgi:hypothetical protein
MHKIGIAGEKKGKNEEMRVDVRRSDRNISFTLDV